MGLSTYVHFFGFDKGFMALCGQMQLTGTLLHEFSTYHPQCFPQPDWLVSAQSSLWDVVFHNNTPDCNVKILLRKPLTITTIFNYYLFPILIEL